MSRMEHLGWEISVLSKAIAYPNLSAAASHVGLSQPQLSRIVAKLESALGLTLLDRSIKRKSNWTEVAQKLVELYLETFRRFQGGLQNLTLNTQQSHLQIGVLEGLIPISLRLCQKIFESTAVKTLELDTEDLNDLEARFAKGDFDVILSFREPSRKKYSRVFKMGYQTLTRTTGPVASTINVLSAFEYASKFQLFKEPSTRARKKGGTKAPGERALISNSLEVRKAWIERFGGHGILPSSVIKQKPTTTAKDTAVIPVLMIGGEQMQAEFWKRLEKMADKI